MKTFPTGYPGLDQYIDMTPEEIEAWNNPERNSYHSLHIERMSPTLFSWRDSRTALVTVGTSGELAEQLTRINCRKVDPDYRSHVQALRILSQTEVDDLLADL